MEKKVYFKIYIWKNTFKIFNLEKCLKDSGK